MRYRNDKDRLTAKIKHKLRWHYTSRFQERKRRLMLYRSYRHWIRCRRGGAKGSGSSCNWVNYMTKIVNPSAGTGDQLASWNSGLYYAGLFGLNYAFSPVYPGKWNEFLGLSGHEPCAKELLHQGYRRVWLPYFEEDKPEEEAMVRDIISSYQGEKIVFFLELHQVYGAQYGVREELKKRFEEAHRGREEALLYREDEVNIAVHVRRGDIAAGQVNGNENLQMRWLDNRYYAVILDTVTRLLSGRRYHIYLFSQGTKEEFAEFAGYGPFTFCGDMPAMESFLHMIRADILVTGKSSFSYKPALIADGIRICPRDFWHGYPEDGDWILAEGDGQFHTEAFKRAFMERGKR